MFWRGDGYVLFEYFDTKGLEIKPVSFAVIFQRKKKKRNTVKFFIDRRKDDESIVYILYKKEISILKKYEFKKKLPIKKITALFFHVIFLKVHRLQLHFFKRL